MTVATIRGDVQLAEPYTLHGGVLMGPIVAGPGLSVYPGAVLGGHAQHRRQGAGRIEIGRDVVIREGATVHRGSVVGCGVTCLGDRVLVMAYAHIGHDGQIGADVTLANGAQLGGHVTIGDRAVLGARCALHQFVSVGRGAMVAAGAMVSGDVPPWTTVAGDRARIVGVNAVGLKAAGFSNAGAVRRGLRLLLDGEAIPDELLDLEPVRDLVSFVGAERHRPLCRRGRR